MTTELNFAAHGEFVLQFGKHKGSMLKDVEDGYLHWLADPTNVDDPQRLRIAGKPAYMVVQEFLKQKATGKPMTASNPKSMWTDDVKQSTSDEADTPLWETLDPAKLRVTVYSMQAMVVQDPLRLRWKKESPNQSPIKWMHDFAAEAYRLGARKRVDGGQDTVEVMYVGIQFVFTFNKGGQVVLTGVEVDESMATTDRAASAADFEEGPSPDLV